MFDSTTELLSLSEKDDSEESSSYDSDEEPAIKKRKKYEKHNWKLINKFQSLEDARGFLKEEWRYHLKYDSVEGCVMKYNCRKSVNCLQKRRIIMMAESAEVHVHGNAQEHNHGPNEEKGIPTSVREEIKRLCQDGVNEPKMILSALRNKGIAEPSITQLNNFLKTFRAKTTTRVVSIGQLEALCRQQEQLPDEEDKPFVAHYHFEYGNETEDSWFGILITTKRLLQIAENSKCIHADGTYKLNWEGYPVLVAGTSDKDKVFHPLLIAVCKGETEKDFAFMFQGLKKNAPNCRPEVLVADSAEAISTAFETVFGKDYFRIHCWFHLTQNIDKKRGLVPSKELFKKIRKDICVLQLARSQSEFDAAVKLWIKQYQKLAPIFVEYFEKEHVQMRGNWFEGFAIGYPSTNNGLEATNAVIKRCGTFRERLPMGKLFDFMLSQVQAWSTERRPLAPNCKIISDKPTITIQLETKAFAWTQLNTSVRYRSMGNETTYYVAASNTAPLKESDVEKYCRLLKHNSWKTFDTYAASMSRLWVVRFNNENWVNSGCSCPSFLKNSICKHILGMAIKTKKHDVRPEAKSVPLGQKRKRGRPSKAKKALLVQ